ncbi:MAG TPA: DinB family protein [Gemmatimonadales bacterium]|nr:DinB family protein [Gemmatimonadales bacterium]
MLSTITKLWAHLAWADGLVLDALRVGSSPAEAVREYAHILGAEEVWLARLEQRASRTPVWPDLPVDQLVALTGMLQQGYRSFLEQLDGPALERVVAYTNTAGRSFENTVQDILLHVALHGQYHRGKVNLILRQQGHSPVPTDYIGYIRGAPAARTEPGRAR